ncbi:exopolysaccharide biosynthesis GT4 family glycosyltransferase EpsE [Alisedimentitalea sp. MJ-SS2]|uniref:exopolysaccharide biosynthesis GT4 family glycosyltransferase EpsE n=1 Tax=Aliisedimentitalea sp. MJ-SS2 TaxID=3049795 RepID=UPI002915C04B|nr:exopolysaccharide biosynthesis GT4 family glycosyltransferase EpsE [Alisedimentitalea sp. MJ-SS2]MDU8926220.1 exopolysaccharide biosynthesis GT4 family glycosyltransferase EpsE [Alisedimentitalea sp. MJ-SS2]
MPEPVSFPVRSPHSLGILIPQFPGQTHIFFWREVLELQKLGVSVTLFSTRPPPPGLISHDWSDEAISRTTYLGDMSPGNATLALPRLPLRALWSDLKREGSAFARDVLISLPAARRLALACHAQGITHVHAHSCGRAALITALAKRTWGLDYSLTLHGPLSDYGPGQGFKWRNAAFGTVITRKLTRELEAELGDDLPPRLYLQPMGVDTEVLQRDTSYEPPSPDGPLRVFSCGRLNVVKGHQDLLQAVRDLRDRGIDARLEIAGEDDAGGSGFHAELQSELRRLNLQDHATLLGAIDGDAVRGKLQTAHIFVLASWHEPLGVAYMEAMSMGLPTIGTDAGGVPELITSGRDGLLVPPKRPDLLADAIAALANDPTRCLALSKAGRTRIEAGFSSTRGAQTLIAGILDAQKDAPRQGSA